jgi:hypothetical protein
MTGVKRIQAWPGGGPYVAGWEIQTTDGAGDTERTVHYLSDHPDLIELFAIYLIVQKALLSVEAKP